MKKRKRIIWTVLLGLLTAAVIWIAWGNTALMTTEIGVTHEDIPENFDRFRIAQISDLHNAEFGKGNVKLLTMLEETDADIIVITGDLVDANKTNIPVAVAFAEKVAEIAPTYYVNGNHEANIGAEYERLKEGLSDAGVTVIENESVLIEKEGQYIKLVGMNDYFFAGDFYSELQRLTEDEMYTVLLAHRPEMFDDYAECGAELVFSGHAHGGQFRLPFIGGVAAPGQGFFPKYDSGKYIKDDTTMVVSRGLGNSIIPFRINNRPEIVVVQLEK